MANANWSNPQLTSTYTNFVSEVKNRDEDLALQFDGTTSTNIPTGTIRWDSSANRWKKWSGSAWGELTSTYALTALSTTGAATVGTTLGVTGAITGSSTVTGTALIPSGSSVPVNGIYLPSANSVAIATNSAQRLAIDSSGNITIPGTLAVTGAITGSSTVTSAAGSATAAGLQVGTGTTYKPGIYSPGSDQLALSTAGTGRLFIDALGNVSLGTASGTNSGGYSTLTLNGSIGGQVAFWSAGVAKQYIYSNSTDLNVFNNNGATIFNNGGFERMRLDSSGRLGIGSTAPNYRLSLGTDLSDIKLAIYDGGNVTSDYGFGIAANQLLYQTNGSHCFRVNNTERLRIDSSGRLLVGQSADVSGSLLQVNGDASIASLNSDSLAGTRSRIMNGGMQIDQRNSGSSISSGVGAVTYTVDRWYVFATTAAVSAQRVTSSNSAFTSALRVIGAASNAGVSIGQRIEVQNSYDMAGRTVTLSFYAASSASVTLTWKTYYAGAANDFTTKTQSNTGTQATTSTLTKYSATFTLSSSATTGVAVEFSVASLTSGSIDITGVQLELGSVATPFERRSFGAELALCQRYYLSERGGGGMTWSTGSYAAVVNFKEAMRSAPTVTIVSVRTGSPNTTASNWAAADVSSGGFRLDYPSLGSNLFADVNYTASIEL